MMDNLFVLGQESRLHILQQAAARVPGCAYICVWAPIPVGQPAAPSSSAAATRAANHHLLCLDAWLCGGGRGDDRASALFDGYRRSVCAVVSGCVPGWAYREGRPYLELPEHDLLASASLLVQQQFYQAAGIQMAAFMGCESGEIEVGMSTVPAIGAPVNQLRASVEQVFSEDFFQRSLIEELLQLPPTRPSSSSSSLPSISVGSPVDGSTSLLRTMGAMSSATPSPRELAMPPIFHPRPPHPVPISRHGLGQGAHVHFPSPAADDAAMAQAMLLVISSSPPDTRGSGPSNYRTQRSPRRRRTAFRPYNVALAPRAPRRKTSTASGQRMIKMSISILRRMRTLNYNQERTTGAAAAPERGQEEDTAAAFAPPTSSQLHHMISERRRRERLNESFESLRGLLPSGSKKDKATVLANTLDYMNILIAQVSELEAKNRTLEAAAAAAAQSQMIQRRHIDGGSPWQSLLQAAAAGPSGDGSGSSEIRAKVEVTSSSGTDPSNPSLPQQQPEPREVTVRVAAPGVELSELVVRVLKLLKETGRFTVVAVDGVRQPASDGHGVPQTSMTLRATGGELHDEASLREAVAKAVEGPVTPPPPPPPDSDGSPS